MSDERECPACGGDGQVYQVVTAERMNGTVIGVIDRRTYLCGRCHGTGRVEEIPTDRYATRGQICLIEPAEPKETDN
jgi:DnaJ-class molecular chaperone